MGFNTLPFVFVFLPLFLAAFYLVPARWRAGLLCLGSLVFYVIGVWQRPWCLAPLLGLAVLVYLLGLRMRPRESRGLLVLGLAALFGCLFFFKYAGLLGLGVTLPLAISFYSFQLAAYLIDVYRGRVPAERKPLLFFTGVLLFPKLLSGPLMDPLSLHEQLSDPPRPGLEDFDSGLREFILGLSMKVLLANQIGGLWRQVGNIGYESVSTPLAWMGIAAYSLQLYLDFCGYSWMALGLGRMLGFRLPRNFEHPYAARSMQDFWRRWHISLSTWLRDYLYISLGGNRKGRIRTYFNLLVTMLLGGLWHGAAVRFILWGALHGIALALHKLWLSVVPGSKATGAEMRWFWRIPGIFFTFNLVCFGWLMFRAESMKTVQLMLHQIFTNFNPSVIPQVLEGYAGIFLLVGIGYLLHMLPDRCDRWAQRFVTSLPTIVQVLLAACVIWLVMQVKSSDIQPFIYFQF